MKYFLVTTILWISAFSGQYAQAGHENGNNGGGWLCPNPLSGSYVELLDLWEASKLRDLNVPESKDPISVQLERALKKLGETTSPRLASETQDWLTFIEGKMASPKAFLDKDVGLAPPRDSLHRYIKKGCQLVGIALFDDVHSLIELDASYLAALSLTGQAALRFHEAVYKALRKIHGAPDSRLARTITGCVFSDGKCEELDPYMSIPEANVVRCAPRYAPKYKQSDKGSVTEFVIYPQSSTENFAWSMYRALSFAKGCMAKQEPWRIQVTQINNMRPPVAAYSDICLTQGIVDDLMANKANDNYLPSIIEGFFKSSDDPKVDAGFGGAFNLTVVNGLPRFNDQDYVCKISPAF